MHQLFRVLVADIVDPRRRAAGVICIAGNVIDNARYYTDNVIDMGEIAAHLAMVKKLDRRAFEDRLGKQENRHVGPAPWPIDGKEPQAR